MAVNRQQFAQAVLQAGGWPTTQSNLNFLLAWMNREGGSAAFNPLNTTQAAADATNYNKVGVKNYTSLQEGVAETVATLQGSLFANVRSALSAGTATEADQSGQLASDLHAWSAGPNAPMTSGYTSVTSKGALKNILGTATQAVSEVGSAVASGVAGADQTLSEGDIDGFLQSQAPALAKELSDPAVKALLNEWGSGQLSDEEFQNSLEATAWWKNTPASQRQLLVTQATDPATALQNITNQQASIDSLAWSKGIKLTPALEYQLALNSIKNQWSTQQLTEQIVAANQTTYTNAGSYGGEAATDVQQIKSLYDSFALPVTDQLLNQQTQAVLSGKSTVADLQQQVAQQAATLYASNPQLAEFVKSGQGTVKQWADPYVQAAAQLLGQNPNNIDVTAPQWSFILKPQTDPNTGTSTGQALSIDGLQQKIQTDPVFGYSKTASGIAQYQNMAQKLVESFGGSTVSGS